MNLAKQAQARDAGRERDKNHLNPGSGHNNPLQHHYCEKLTHEKEPRTPWVRHRNGPHGTLETLGGILTCGLTVHHGHLQFGSHIAEAR
jgi:hypothetical protein